MKATGPVGDNDDYAALQMPPMFRALRSHAHAERRIFVDFRRGSLNFEFCTEPTVDGADPTVVISTPDRIYALDCIDDVLTTARLAHELSHHESWSLGETSDEYEEVMARDPRAFYDRPHDLPRALHEERLADERRAWVHGRAILARAVRVFSAWEAYEAEAARAVACYEQGIRALLAPVPRSS